MTKVAAISVPNVTVPVAAAIAAKSVAPGQVKKAAAAPPPAVVHAPAPAPRPVAQSLAASAMAALIQAQAGSENEGKGHTDPQPTHGADDQHGHAPPVVAPPVIQPPIVQPPVVQPPVVQPPVAAPPPVVVSPPVAQPPAAHTDPQSSHGADDAHGHAPPVVTPPVIDPPVVHPPIVPPPPVVTPPAPPVVKPRPVDHGDDAAAARADAMVNRMMADVALSTLARSNFESAAAARHTAAYVRQAGVAISLLGVMQGDMQAFNASWSSRGLRI